MIHETAIVEKNTQIGNNTNIWHFSHIRTNAKIGNNCNLGMAVFVDSEVSIGNNCKIQNKSSLYHGLTVENDVFIGPHVAFTNDMYPRATNNNFEVIKTLVKNGASIGANSTIRCGITIGQYAMIGAGSVVTKDVPDFGLVVGNPARLIGTVDKSGQKNR